MSATVKTVAPPAPSDVKLEYVPCDLCGAIDPSPYMDVKDRLYGIDGAFKLVRCGYCELTYLNPRPDRNNISAFYPGEDYHAFKPHMGMMGRVKDWLRKNEAAGLMAGLPSKPRILEVGCATGELLSVLKSMGADVVGIEPSDSAVKVAKETFGLHVHTGSLETVALEPGQFDLVLMKYALEHVHSPAQALTAIRKLLKPGGRAVFWIPNAKSLDAKLFGNYWRGYDAPRHLYIFSRATIVRYLAATGFTTKSVAYSPVPNDWAGSVELWLREKQVAPTIAKWFGLANPLVLLAWLPISTLAALFRAAGRIQVVAETPRPETR
jgi:2-polyprenyl-3-methyl-5-hydroxy-6-metoxy-1,4-benzoquinol methylase